MDEKIEKLKEMLVSIGTDKNMANALRIIDESIIETLCKFGRISGNCIEANDPNEKKKYTVSVGVSGGLDLQCTELTPAQKIYKEYSHIFKMGDDYIGINTSSTYYDHKNKESSDRILIGETPYYAGDVHYRSKTYSKDGLWLEESYADILIGGDSVQANRPIDVFSGISTGKVYSTKRQYGNIASTVWKEKGHTYYGYFGLSPMSPTGVSLAFGEDELENLKRNPIKMPTEEEKKAFIELYSHGSELDRKILEEQFESLTYDRLKKLQETNQETIEKINENRQAEPRS